LPIANEPGVLARQIEASGTLPVFPT